MNTIDLTGYGMPTKARGRKKGSKGKKEKPEKPITQVVTERAAAQIIARAQAKADALDKEGGDAILKQLEYQAKCKVEGEYKYIFTGGSHLLIFPDGSKEVAIPAGLRGKIFKRYRALLLNEDNLRDED